MSQTSRDRVNSGRVLTHEKDSGDAVRRLGRIIQSIFCAQSGASIRLKVWKWSGESRYPGAFPPVLENFRRPFSLGSTDRPWVSEDDASPITVLRLLTGYGLETLTYYHRVHNIPSPVYKSGTKAHYGVN